MAALQVLNSVEKLNARTTDHGERNMTINQYFSKVKSLCDEISKLDLENAITETKMRRIIVHGWPRNQLYRVGKLLANEEDLEKSLSNLTCYKKAKIKALDKRQDYQKKKSEKLMAGKTKRINIKKLNDKTSKRKASTIG
ncbi:hypothetical protein H5410_047427 [Solanum commersonii]|uniref:Uncharacterized protein n=1 Tax=Solanum commersonii TaxID=4109 RepID=A0A9J5XF34_SOLCO|nr:hypothetical protein H5410_047427 [Solanum commersonii]